MSKEDKDLFLKEKPVMTLIAVRRNREKTYVSLVQKKIDTTYAHTCKVVSQLEDKGYIESKKKGRKKFLELTEKGTEKADLFGKLLDTMGDTGTALA